MGTTAKTMINEPKLKVAWKPECLINTTQAEIRSWFLCLLWYRTKWAPWLQAIITGWWPMLMCSAPVALAEMGGKVGTQMSGTQQISMYCKELTLVVTSDRVKLQQSNPRVSEESQGTIYCLKRSLGNVAVCQHPLYVRVLMVDAPPPLGKITHRRPQTCT